MVYRAALSTGEPEMYYSKFVMFQMGDFSELHAMCNVRLCITNAEAACDTQSPVRSRFPFCFFIPFKHTRQFFSWISTKDMQTILSVFSVDASSLLEENVPLLILKPKIAD